MTYSVALGLAPIIAAQACSAPSTERETVDMMSQGVEAADAGTGQTCESHSISGNSASLKTVEDVVKCMCEGGTEITDVNSTELCPARTCAQPTSVEGTICDGNTWDTSGNPVHSPGTGGYGWKVTPPNNGAVHFTIPQHGESVTAGPDPNAEAANAYKSCVVIRRLHADCSVTYTRHWINGANSPNWTYAMNPWDNFFYMQYAETEALCMAMLPGGG